MAQGDILYRAASAWKRLAAGTSGKFLKTQGAGADPLWDTPADTGITQLTGDGTAGPGSGSQVLTLANSGASAGSYGSATLAPVVTVDAKGRVTSITTATITPGAGSGGALTQLQQIVTAASQASVDFTSIPGGYSALLIMWVSQNTNSGTGGSSTYLKMNNDGTAGNYTSASRIGVQNTSPTSGSAVAATTNGMYVNDMPNSGNTNIAGIGQFLIVGYAGTTFTKSTWTSWETEWSGLLQLFTIRARWKNTAAITRLTFTVDTGAFTNNSVYTLYGMS